MSKVNILPYLLLSAIVGILLGYNSTIPLVATTPFVLLAALGLLVFCWLRRQIPAIIFACLLFASLAVAGVTLELNPRMADNHITKRIEKDNTAINIVGSVARMPESYLNKTEILLRPLLMVKDGIATNTTGDILLIAKGAKDVVFGDIIKVSTRLSSPHSFKNFGGFDYERYLLRDNIFLRGSIVSADSSLVLLKRGGDDSIKFALENFRQQIKDAVTAASSTPQREIIQALILGIKKGIDRAVRDDFIITGTAHIIAISGFHIAIVAGMFSLLIYGITRLLPLSLLVRINRVKIALILATIPVIIFCFIAGATPSVTRATIMIAMFMLAIVWRRHVNFYSVICVAALAMLAYSPISLFDISFQLSFAAVLSIAFIGNELLARFPQRSIPRQAGWQFYRAKILFALVSSLIVTLAVTVGTMPIVALHFNQLSLIGILANMTVVPLMGFLVIPVCVAVPFVLPFSAGLAGLLIATADFFIAFILNINRFFASLPHAFVYLPTPSWGEVLAYYMLVFTSILYLKGKKRAIIAVLLIASLIVLSGDYLLRGEFNRSSKQLQVDIIDVGSGNSALLVLPDGKTMLIDGGGLLDDSFNFGKMVIAPFLWKKRITKLDYVILSHPHPDHLNGLVFIAQAFAVGEVWKGSDEAQTEAYQEFMETIHAKKIPLKILLAEDYQRSIAGVEFKVFYGSHSTSLKNGEENTADKANENSLVVRASFGNTSILFSGDISDREEGKLVKLHQRNLTSDILLSPHHGSRFSSSASFVKAIAPRLVVVSCGVNNIYGHPAPRVLERYREHGAKILRTDNDGQVSLKLDGTSIQYCTFSHPVWLRL